MANDKIILKESEKKYMYLGLFMELIRTMKHKGDNNTICYWVFWYSHQRIIKGTGGLGNKRLWGDHPKLLHYWERPEYWEESWKHEETYCLSNSRERPSAITGVKNSQGVNYKYVINISMCVFSNDSFNFEVIALVLNNFVLRIIHNLL